MREVVGAPGRDVDREVADQTDVAPRGVLAERAPLALEPDLVVERVAARERGPVVDPVRLARREVLALLGRDGRIGLGEEPRPARERRRGLVRRADLVRRAEREQLPPRLAGRGEPVDEREGLFAQPPAGKRRWVEQDSARAGKLHGCAATEVCRATTANPDPRRASAGGLRSLPGQGGGRRRRAGLGHDCAGRARGARRGRAGQAARRRSLAGDAARAGRERPLRGLLRGRRARALVVPARGVGRPRRVLSMGGAPEARGGGGRPEL